MAIELTPAGITTGDWHTVNTDGTDTWFDDQGVGWDMDYVARYELMRASLKGGLICAWDQEYDEARVTWTGVENCWPAALVQCLGAEDIQQCVAFAERYKLEISIREPLSGYAAEDGALVIDLASFVPIKIWESKF